jgi:hypothetical protein
MKTCVPKQARARTVKDKMTRTGTFCGYELTGWRFTDDEVGM